jgi:hypothetical protein
MTPADVAAAAWGEVWRYRIEQVETVAKTLDADKADKTEIASVIKSLEGIKKILMAVLMAIVLGSIGFAFTAIQLVSQHA